MTQQAQANASAENRKHSSDREPPRNEYKGGRGPNGRWLKRNGIGKQQMK